MADAVTPTEAAPVTGDDFPCESFKDAARHMRRPFTPAAVKFKVQATWPKDNPASGLIVAYIDARLAVERLNLLVPHLWRDEYRPVGQGQMWCDLTVDGITRSDIGEGVGKGLVSDALKRAAVKFGIGVSLYAIPKMILDVQSGALKSKRTSKGPTLELTPRGEQILRDTYEHWLDAHGSEAFGEPLNHGDVEDAQGDHEAGEVPPGVDPQTGELGAGEPSGQVVAQPAQPTEKVATAKQRGLINSRAADTGLTRVQLLNVIRACAGQEPVTYDDENRAQQALNRNLDRLPARLVDPILETIAQIDTPEPLTA